MNNHYMRYTIAALLRSPLVSKVQAMMTAKHLFNWPLHEVRDKFNEIADRCYLADSGMLCVRRGDAVYAETGDRCEYIGAVFLAECSVEQAAALRDAKDRLLATIQGEEG